MRKNKKKKWEDMINQSVYTADELNVTEDEVKTNYERKIVPDPSRYYMKDYPSYSIQFPELRLIPPKYKRPDRSAAIIHPGDPKKYRCALCEKAFKTEQELSRHVASAH